MKNKLHFKPVGLVARTADWIMKWLVMYPISGTFKESPQQTHRWNNIRLKPSDLAHILTDYGVQCKGIDTKVPFRGIRFHIPILGGWRKYVVLNTAMKTTWFVGWITETRCGMSRIPLHGPVRMLIGPGDVTFFAINARDRIQINLYQIGEGRIGDGGRHAKVPLL